MAFQKLEAPAFVRDMLAGDPVRIRAFASAFWPQLVGAEIASRTKVLKIENATLVVGVPDASWRRELHRLQPAVLGRLRELLGTSAPRRLGFMEARAAATPARSAPRDQPPAVPEAPHPGVVDAAAVIPEPHLRELFIRTASNYLRTFSGEARKPAVKGGRA